MYIALTVGHQAALAVIPMDKVIISDLTMALVGPIRRLHLMVKGGTEHFDLTLLGNKIDLGKAETEDARNVTELLQRVISYAEFLGHDHISFHATDNLMGYAQSEETRLVARYMRSIDCAGVEASYKIELARLKKLQARIVMGIDQPLIWW